MSSCVGRAVVGAVVRAVARAVVRAVIWLLSGLLLGCFKLLFGFCSVRAARCRRILLLVVLTSIWEI